MLGSVIALDVDVYRTRYKIHDTGYTIFIAMQACKVEMMQENYATLQNIKQHELYYSHSRPGN